MAFVVTWAGCTVHGISLLLIATCRLRCGQCSSVAPRYQITLDLAEDNAKVRGIAWQAKPQVRTREALQGCYVISTTHLEMEADRIWSLYMSLVRVEAAFTHQRSTVSLRGEGDTVHQVRLSSTPEPVHQEIYRLLEVKDPLVRRQRSRKAGP